tara:strand:+ start:236 stop:415 length:180 start_codon:yes stop_codon:yes gene_type:complete
MKRVEKMKISKGYESKVEGGAYRQALVELGMYSIPTHKVHANKKKYNRKKLNNKWTNIV